MLTNIAPLCDRVSAQVGTTLDADAQLASCAHALVDKDGNVTTRKDVADALPSTTLGKALGAADDLTAVLAALGVQIGADDSGGTGFRALVLPNSEG